MGASGGAAELNRYTAPAVEIVACKMSLLLRRKGGLFSKDYELMDKDSVVCFMQFDDWRHASLLIEGKRYLIRANGRGRWILEGERNLHRWFSKTRHRSSINVDGEFR